MNRIALAILPLTLAACAQPQQLPQPERAPAIPNPSAMAAAQAAMGVQSAPDAPHPGKAIYEKACAACHDNPEATRSPSLSTLQAMRYQTISYALTQGKMQTQAAALTPQERTAVVDFLVGREATMMSGSRKRSAQRSAARSISTLRQR